ncbi:MAG TPA: hypothetical protein ACFYD6_11950 [Candidatus Brocadiia bacterium]|nr:hypothetical protein [Candidatus Brocadiales bacterium]
MRTISKILEIVENRVRNPAKMKNASKDIDRRRKKAPKGWNTVEIIRQMREARK